MAFCAASRAAASQSLDCDGALAGVGESKVSVIQKCGEPVWTEQVCVGLPQTTWAPPSYPGGPRQFVLPLCEPMEDWVYHRGEGRFLGIVRFRNGTVESVRDGDRAR